MRFYSSLSKIIKHYDLKHRLPIMHQQFFKVISQKPDFVKTHCNDLIFPPDFAICKWMVKQ